MLCNHGAPQQSVEGLQRGCLLGRLGAAVPQQVGHVLGDEPEGARVRKRRVLLEQRGARLKAVITGLRGIMWRSTPGLAMP